MSMLDSLKKYLIQINTKQESSSDSNNNLFKCKNCRLLFVDIRLLKEHQSNCSMQHEMCQVVVNEKAPSELNDCDQNSNQSSCSSTSTNNSTTSGAKIRLFKCSFCKKIYLNKTSFISHTVVCTKTT